MNDCGSCDNCRDGLTDHYYCIHTGKQIIDLNKVDEACPLPKLNKRLTIGLDEMHFARSPTYIAFKRGYKLTSVIEFSGFVHVLDAANVKRIDETLFIEV